MYERPLDPNAQPTAPASPQGSVDENSAGRPDRPARRPACSVPLPDGAACIRTCAADLPGGTAALAGAVHRAAATRGAPSDPLGSRADGRAGRQSHNQRRFAPGLRFAVADDLGLRRRRTAVGHAGRRWHRRRAPVGGCAEGQPCTRSGGRVRRAGQRDKACPGSGGTAGRSAGRHRDRSQRHRRRRRRQGVARGGHDHLPAGRRRLQWRHQPLRRRQRRQRRWHRDRVGRRSSTPTAGS